MVATKDLFATFIIDLKVTRRSLNPFKCYCNSSTILLPCEANIKYRIHLFYSVNMLLETFFHALPGDYLAFVVPAALVGYWVAWIIYSRTLHPLSHIPGPFGASVSRFWIMWRTARGDMEHTQRSLHKKYGPLVRIAPNEIACADPNAIKKIYRTSQPLRKTDFYPIWGNKTFSKYPDNFSGTDEQLHSERRRIVNHVYSLSNVLQFETFIDRCSELFMTRLGELADGVQVIDLGEWLQW